jgi:hypothetical protein
MLGEQRESLLCERQIITCAPARTLLIVAAIAAVE